MEVEKIMETSRGNVCVILNNYKYRKIREFVNGNVKFSCTKKDCQSVIHTTPDFKTVLSVMNDHQHKAYSEEKIKKDLKRIKARTGESQEITKTDTEIIDTWRNEENYYKNSFDSDENWLYF